MLILGIETSCDETAVAVLEDGEGVLRGGAVLRANLIARQTDLHERFGGVVPEVAARAHVEALNPLLERALEEAGCDFADLGGVAVTVGPGLVGALLVGMAAAKAVALATGAPLIGVNHLEGHIWANFLEHGPPRPPYVCLVVSGGHTLLVHMPELHRHEVLGRTLDDAAGEAFDKIARFLGLGFPGGPALDRLAREGDPDAIRFPRAMEDSGDYDFSMSGLKTAVLPLVSQGCRPVGSPYTVTAARGNLVLELGGEPPLRRLTELLERLPPEDAELVRRGVQVGLVIDEYVEDPGPGDHLIRGVLGFDPDSGAMAVGEQVEVGRTLRFHVRDARTADRELREALERERERLGRAPAGALLFTCNGRGRRMFGVPDHDAGLVSDVLGGPPLAGSFCAGEIGPVGGRNFLHGFTASLALFAEDAPGGGAAPGPA